MSKVTSNIAKKNIGALVLALNADILDLQQEVKRLGDTTSWSSKAESLEKSVKEKKEALETTSEGLKVNNEYAEKEGFERTLKMMKTSIETAKKVLQFKVKREEVEAAFIEKMNNEASEVMKDVDEEERKAEEEAQNLVKVMDKVIKIGTKPETSDSNCNEEVKGDKVETELNAIDKYHAERVKRMKEEIVNRMSNHKKDLEEKWEKLKDVLDYQALKEIRTEFEATYKKLRNMVNEFDRRRISDLLSDHLMDIVDEKYDDYMETFRRMDEEKRVEAALARKRNLELEEYRKEKRRDIPSWPHTLPYTKFKQDLAAWDKEHHLSSGSVKFGLLAEMLKKNERVQTYEQIQTRLGSCRNEPNIITQVLALLDSINEETVFNKLSTAWEAITALKKEKRESLNDFFSRFETLQFSLNLADTSYEVLEPVKAGMDIKYYERREKILKNRVEFNDKLKVVHLLKALGIDEAHKRDIITKIDFNKEPEIVFEDAKTAIRDICNDETAFKEEQVLVVKPWKSQENQSDTKLRGEGKSYSRSYSGGRSSRSPYRRRDDQRRFSHDRDGGNPFQSRDRSGSWSRSRERTRPRVAFRDGQRAWRRDQTPRSGRTETIHQCNIAYDCVYKTEEFFRQSDKVLGQAMILDCGCPRSLMGRTEFEKIKKKFKFQTAKTNITEKFRFGPSRVYESTLKVKLRLNIENKQLIVWFFVIDGEVPILLGNDILEKIGAKIDLRQKALEINEMGIKVPLLKSSGGHFILPLANLVAKKDEIRIKEKEDEPLNDVEGAEADAVMIIAFARMNTKEDLQELHNQIGHKVFVEIGLKKCEEEKIMKVHRYFGHRSGRRIWELFAKAGKMKGKRRLILDLIDKCKICSKMKKSPPRPKVGLPVAYDFNQVVAMDLSIVNKDKGEYILWLVDTFSKLIKGKYIRNKNPSTIIESIISTWIIGDGSGPGHPQMGFYTDNGGEFLSEEMLDFAAYMDVNINMTSANSPWQNGICERNHATADVIFQKILSENPTMDRQEAVNFAAFSKNSEINKTRFSALQLMSGQNPHFPGLAEKNPASTNVSATTKYMKKLKLLDEARVKYREIECNDKLKKVEEMRINPNVENSYEVGDLVYFFDDKRKHWKKGTVLAALGKTVYLKFGNFLRRVPLDKCRPDINGEEVKEETYLEPAEEDDEKRFNQLESQVEDMLPDLDLAAKNKQLEKEIEELRAKNNTGLDNIEEESKDTVNEEAVIENKEDDIQEKRRMKRQRKKLKKEKSVLPSLPKQNQLIKFKRNQDQQWSVARVTKVYKKTSKYQNCRHLQLENGEVLDVDFSKDIDEWKDALENESNEAIDSFYLSEILAGEHESYPVKIVPKSEYYREEIQEAMKSEINKFESFDAFTEVEDIGQDFIPIRWVVTEKNDDGKNQPFKARLCVRGDKEIGKENVRTDSPTAAKESIKIAMNIAVNEGFSIKCGDIKSAYLQGNDLTREVLVKPPDEANVKGKLWRLKRGAYGMLDGGRLFYLKLEEKMIELGLHEVHSDGALFTYVKNGKLHGLVAANVDDLLMIGDKVFEEEVSNKLQELFKFSKIEDKDFTYCGCRITMKDDGSIILDQNKYLSDLEHMEEIDGEEQRALTDSEKKKARGKVGALLWISLITRPDLCFDVNVLSREVTTGTVKTVKEINRVISNAKLKDSTLRFVKLGELEDLEVKVYADASFCNQEGSIKSTAGRVILLQNPKTNMSNIVSWKTKKINRVCRSVKTAETRAMDDAIDEGIHTARIIKEIYNGSVNLRNPEQVPVSAYTDSKSLWESLHNSRQCEERLLRNTVALLKELMQNKMVKSIQWVPTDKQLADCMTKKGSKDKANWLLDVAKTNYLKI